ncbi:MAG TPA: hypothetical protein VGF71_16525 [Caulobacteraceae bacterium]|jgi:hypothetical protein
MASSWTEHGPIALPPRPLALGMGAALVLLAFVGVGLGMRAAWKDTGAPDLGGTAADSADSADTLTAKPIVELPAPPPASNTAENTSAADEADNSDAIQQKTAEAQQVQSNASKSGADIDQILTSPTEKPTAPTKSGAVEAPPPPGPPVKSDVPF